MDLEIISNHGRPIRSRGSDELLALHDSRAGGNVRRTSVLGHEVLGPGRVGPGSVVCLLGHVVNLRESEDAQWKTPRLQCRVGVERHQTDRVGWYGSSGGGVARVDLLGIVLAGIPRGRGLCRFDWSQMAGGIEGRCGSNGWSTIVGEVVGREGLVFVWWRGKAPIRSGRDESSSSSRVEAQSKSSKDAWEMEKGKSAAAGGG